MNDKQMRNDFDQTQSDPEIFGRSRSREEIKAEEKERKHRHREEMKQARKDARAARKAATTDDERRVTVIMLCILAAVVIGCGVLLAVQIAKGTKQEQFARDEENYACFTDEGAQPELSDEGLTAAVNEVYYTKGGYLCVKMTLGNGLDKPQHMSALEVKISNGDTDELIASGYTQDISKNFVVAPQGFENYTFYISPEYVVIKDDPLTILTYSITATGYGDEE